jgi:hypothetical protein
MSRTEIGGDLSNREFARLFLAGVLLGSAIRLVAFLFPVGVVRQLEAWLLPDS